MIIGYDTGMIDWVEFNTGLTFREYTSGYMRRPCKGQEEGCLWLLLRKPNTGGDYSDMKFRDTLGALSSVS